MDEKALLESISQMIDQKLEPIKQSITTIESEQQRMGQSIAVLENEQERMGQSITVIENEHGKMLKAIYEGFQGIHDKQKGFDVVESKVEDHSHRIFALEQLAKAK